MDRINQMEQALNLGYRRQQSLLIYFMGALGTIIEWYDFAIYGHLAPVFGKLFFVEKSSWLSLVFAYMVFFISYLVRPLGALIYGYIGDYLGRRTALLLSITMMNISMLIMAFLPTWQTIGILAPFVLLIFRIVQGMSTGGETAGALIYVLESVSEKRQGFYGSLIWMTALLGVLIGSATVAWLTNTLSTSQLYAWGWRVPYFIGIGLGSAIFIFRALMPESIAFAQAQQSDRDDSSRVSPLKEVFQAHKYDVLLVTFFTALPAASMTFILYYFPQSVHRYQHIVLSEALRISTLMIFMMMVLMVIAGYLSDHFGKITVVALSIVGFLFFSYPVMTITIGANWQSIMIAQLILTSMSAMYDGPFPAVITNLSPLRVRYTIVALGYNTGFALFGGAAPLVSVLLVHRLHNYAASTFYLIAMAIFSLIALSMLCYRKKVSVGLNMTAAFYSKE